MMRSLTSSRPAWSASSTSRASTGIELLVGALAPRHGDQPVEVGPDHRGLARLLAHALEPAELLRGLLAHVVGHAGLGDLRAVLLRRRSRSPRPARAGSTPSACAGSTRAAASSAPDWTSSRILRRSCSSVSRSRWILHGELEALGDVERLEHLHLLLEGDVGRVADRVGQRAGLDDRAQERRRRARRRRAARGSPRRRRGTRARRRACGRRRGCRRGARSPRRAGGRGSRCGRRRRRRGRRRRADTARPPPGRRTWSVTSAIVPTFANSPSWRGTSRTRSSSPASTGSVTSIVGKTTVSSRGRGAERSCQKLRLL